MGRYDRPGALMDFRASSLPYRFDGLKGPRKFTGLEDAGSDRRQSKESDQEPLRAGACAIGLGRSPLILVDRQLLSVREPLIRRNLLC